MSGAIPPLPQGVFMTWCLVKKAQGDLSLRSQDDYHYPRKETTVEGSRDLQTGMTSHAPNKVGIPTADNNAWPSATNRFWYVPPHKAHSS
jgi:hypothetical protein